MKQIILLLSAFLLLSCGNNFNNWKYKYKVTIPEGYTPVMQDKMSDEAISFTSTLEVNDILINYKDVDVVFYNRAKDHPHYEQISITTIPSYVNIRKVGSEQIENMLLQSLAYKFDDIRINRSENYKFGKYNGYRIDFVYNFNGEALQSTTVFIPGTIFSTQLVTVIYPSSREKGVLEVLNTLLKSYKKI